MTNKGFSLQECIDEKLYCEQMLSMYEGAMTHQQSLEYSSKIAEYTKIIQNKDCIPDGLPIE